MLVGSFTLSWRWSSARPREAAPVLRILPPALPGLLSGSRLAGAPGGCSSSRWWTARFRAGLLPPTREPLLPAGRRVPSPGSRIRRSVHDLPPQKIHQAQSPCPTSSPTPGLIYPAGGPSNYRKRGLRHVRYGGEGRGEADSGPAAPVCYGGRAYDTIVLPIGKFYTEGVRMTRNAEQE